MGKAPAFQLYAMDWMRDLDEHPLEIEGAWIRICCKMWFAEPRGEMTKTVQQWARILRESEAEAERVLRYIGDEKIGSVTFCNGKVTVKCRRMVRDERERKANADRQKRHRLKKERGNNDESNGEVTSPSSSSSSTSSNKEPSSLLESLKIDLPESLDNPEFRKTWDEWETYRKESKKKLTATTVRKQIKRLGKHTTEAAVAMLDRAMEKGWTGFHEIGDGPPARKQKKADPAMVAEIHAELDEKERLRKERGEPEPYSW